MRTQTFAIATLVTALSGFVFASFATYDFAAHLDRQTHDIHCSFVPGLANPAHSSTGCQVTMLSRYSSVLRTHWWGGIPISLPGMCVFAFLAFFSTYLLVTGTHREERSAGFAAVAWLVPFFTSLVMGYIAFVELDAACKLCIGIYTSSTLGAIFALLMWRASKGPAADETVPYAYGGPADGTTATVPQGAIPQSAIPGREHSIGWAIVLAVLFVLVPTGAYVAAMPDYSAYQNGCGQLAHPEDRYNVLVSLGGMASGTPAIEVLDPLCPACRAFESRLEASGLEERLSRKALLFPLDDECNWMVSSALHPGACAVSEAILCEPNQAGAILDWSFSHQEEITSAERASRGAAARMVQQQFPSVRGCVGSTRIRSQLHRGLRWAVSNELPVLTPQLFVNGRKLCNEDTDLGLEYSLSRMLESTAGGTR